MLKGMEKALRGSPEEWEWKAYKALKYGSIRFLKQRGLERPGGILLTWQMMFIVIFLIIFQAVTWGVVLGALWFGE